MIVEVRDLLIPLCNQRNQLMEELQDHLDHPALTAFLALMVLMAKPDFLATLDPQVHPDQLDPVARAVAHPARLANLVFQALKVILANAGNLVQMVKSVLPVSLV